MVNALDTVADYVAQARVLMQDTYGPAYRYESIDIVNALNFGLMRARQLRSDLFIKTDGVVPYFVAEDATVVAFDVQYRQGLLMFIVGHIQLRDDEDTTDERASAFMNSFVTQLEMGSAASSSGG